MTEQELISRLGRQSLLIGYIMGQISELISFMLEEDIEINSRYHLMFNHIKFIEQKALDEIQDLYYKDNNK